MALLPEVFPKVAFVERRCTLVPFSLPGYFSKLAGALKDMYELTGRGRADTRALICHTARCCEFAARLSTVRSTKSGAKPLWRANIGANGFCKTRQIHLADSKGEIGENSD